MKYYGKITDPKDLVTKEYADAHGGGGYIAQPTEPSASDRDKLWIDTGDTTGGGGGSGSGIHIGTEPPTGPEQVWIDTDDESGGGGAKEIHIGDSTPTGSETFWIDTDEEPDISIETTPTSGSLNLVTSGGIYTALSGKQDKLNVVTGSYMVATCPTTLSDVYTLTLPEGYKILKVGAWFHNSQPSMLALGNGTFINYGQTSSVSGITTQQLELTTFLNATTVHIYGKWAGANENAIYWQYAVL